MNGKFASKLWKVKILLGRYPAKIDEYRIYKLRKDIIELFNCIHTVVYRGTTIDEVKEAFLSNMYMVDSIAEDMLIRTYKLRKSKQKRITIIYERNDKLKWEVTETEENKFIVKIPRLEF